MKRISLVVLNILTIVAMAGIIAYLLIYPPPNAPKDFSLPLVVVILLLSAITEIYDIKLPSYGYIPSADTFYYVLMITSPPITLIIIPIITNTIKEIYKHKDQRFHLFHILYPPFAFIISGLLFYNITNLTPFFKNIYSFITNSFFLVLSAFLCITLKNYMHNLHQFLEGEFPPSYIWEINTKKTILYLSTIVPLAILIVAIKEVSLSYLALLLPPLALMYFSIKKYSDLLYEVKSALEILAGSIEMRDPYMIDHAERVAQYSVEIAKKLNLPTIQIEHIKSAAKMHDIGKVAIADEILMKMEPLSPEEMERIKKHSVLGGEVASKLSFCQEEANIIKHHHERYDGKGYPDGLKGDEIPIGSRIIAVAEAFDVMTTAKAYSKAMSFKEALEEIKKEKGTQFDPKVVDAFSDVLKERLEKFE